MKSLFLTFLAIAFFGVVGCEISLDGVSDAAKAIEDEIEANLPEDDLPEDPPPPPPPEPEPSGPGTVDPQGAVLTNPAISEGQGYDQHCYWKIYDPPYRSRRVSIRWPTDLYTVYGCRPENTQCIADGTQFDYYAIDYGDSGEARKLSYTCMTRFGYEFPYGVIPILYKDGVPIAAFSVENPRYGIYQRLPATQQLP